MIEESSLVEQFDLVAQTYRARLLDNGREQGLPTDMSEALADIGARAMESARLLTDLESEITQALSAEDVAVVRDFYRSPLGKKVKRVEAQAYTVRQRAEIESRLTEFRLELNGSPERAQQFESIDRYRLMSELSAEVTGSIIYAVAIGLVILQEGEASEDALAALDVGVDAVRDTFVKLTREDTGAILLATYRRLSNKDLEVFVAFLQTEQARAIHAAILAAAKEILHARQREIAEDFADLIKRSRS
jgi:hypothetical protein